MNSIYQQPTNRFRHLWQHVSKAVPYQKLFLLLVTVVTLLSGILNFSVALHPAWLSSQPLSSASSRDWLPLEFFYLPRSFTLLLGFALIVSAVNIWKRKQRAFVIVLALSVLSGFLPWWRGEHPWQIGLSLLLLGSLLLLRKNFVVQSRQPDLRTGLMRFAVAAVAALGYGVAGFWLLDEQQFGINFNWLDSIHRTLLCVSLLGDSTLTPLTRYAAWFLDSLSVLTVLVLGYGFVALFRPLLYRFRTQPQERLWAQQILQQHGRSALDNFKLWPDKSYFFNRSRDCFLAYRVAANMAVVLADPVGPPEQIEPTLRAFQAYCEAHGWSLALHQTQPTWLNIYRRLGFRKLKLGDDAIVDLTQFALANPRMKRFRQRVGQLEKHGVRFRHYAAPVSDELMTQLREVSDEWLQLPQRRERSFTVGSFAPDYLRTTTIFTAEDAEGKVLAFVNLLVSYRADEVTIDLMRHRLQAPNGIMDYLFVKLFEWSKEQGYTRFNLGMAPMAGFQEREEASAAERLVHAFCQRSNFLFSFSGIRQYKAKFADEWEPRYVVFRHVVDLPNLGLALSRVTEAESATHDLLPPKRTLRNLLARAQETGTEFFKALARRASQAS